MGMKCAYLVKFDRQWPTQHPFDVKKWANEWQSHMWCNPTSTLVVPKVVAVLLVFGARFWPAKRQDIWHGVENIFLPSSSPIRSAQVVIHFHRARVHHKPGMMGLIKDALTQSLGYTSILSFCTVHQYLWLTLNMHLVWTTTRATCHLPGPVWYS